jgi:catechol 2,3-dioxygenase-like lactoylglutathione lyase family enzyme
MIQGLWFDHVGLSVTNLDRAIEFYRDVMGFEFVTGREFSDARYEAIMNLKGAQGRVATLKAQNMQVELFEFFNPTPKGMDSSRPVCDHGITHFCMQVGNLDQTYETLKSAGVRFHCPPFEFVPGIKATYGRDPDGNVFELLELKVPAEQ